MFTINRKKGPAAQGDCFIIPVEDIPEGCVEQKSTDNKLVVAHSETGHHHAVSAGKARLFSVPDNPMVCFLKCEGFVELEHFRPFDTHETLKMPAGNYKILRQREGSPEGWRQVAD